MESVGLPAHPHDEGAACGPRLIPVRSTFAVASRRPSRCGRFAGFPGFGLGRSAPHPVSERLAGYGLPRIIPS